MQRPSTTGEAHPRTGRSSAASPANEPNAGGTNETSYDSTAILRAAAHASGASTIAKIRAAASHVRGAMNGMPDCAAATAPKITTGTANGSSINAIRIPERRAPAANADNTDPSSTSSGVANSSATISTGSTLTGRFS